MMMIMMMMMMMRIDVPRRCSGWALGKVLTVCTLDRGVDSASLFHLPDLLFYLWGRKTERGGKLHNARVAGLI